MEGGSFGALPNEPLFTSLFFITICCILSLQKTLYDKGIKVVFLPPYSQDFNPIEHAWSKIKAYLRKVKARTFEELFIAIGAALDIVTEDDIIGWITHCGYGL